LVYHRAVLTPPLRSNPNTGPPGSMAFVPNLTLDSLITPPAVRLQNQ
jgi:hypothetical protein